MRKKWIIIIIICVLLLAVTALTVYRGLKMDPELAAVGNMGGAAPAGEPEPPEEAEDNAVEESSDDYDPEPPAAQPDTKSASAEPFSESGVIGEGLIGDGYY